MNGIEAALEILAAAGVRHLFGNPGTTELPLNAAVTGDDRFRYVLGIHEIPVVSMADGFAMASGQIGFANVHASCGLGNSMGMLYNAHIERTPLLLTAGQQDRRLQAAEPVLAGDLVSVARDWTKWAAEVQRVEDLPTLLRRAIQTALTPPTGPVFLSLPVDVQLALADGLDLSPPYVPDPRTRPPIEALRRAAELLVAAKSPVILAGSRVTESDAVEELTALAERLGAPVFAEGTPSHGRLPISPAHPLYAGVLPYWSREIHDRLADFDLVLAVGLSVLRLYIHESPDCPLPSGTRVIHLDKIPWEIGKNYPVAVGLIGDPQPGLNELDQYVGELISPDQKEAAHGRGAKWSRELAVARARFGEQVARDLNGPDLTSLALMGALARVLPANVAVVEEAITTHHNAWERLGVLPDPKGFFAHRGWALGWGLGCALGVKLAWPERPVLALIGDGAALYGLQALWTAAHEQLPITIVIANNAEYRILKVCGEVLGLDKLRDPASPGLSLVSPQVDFVQLARGLGVAAQRVTNARDLSDSVQASLSGDGPQVIEVRVIR